MDRVFVSGYFGFGNLGDEAILEAVVSELRTRHPGVALAASFGKDRSTAERLRVAAVDFFGIQATADAIVGSDLVLFGLGGVFQDYWGATTSALTREGTNGVEAYTRPALFARMTGVPAALCCAGVGPLRTPAGRAMFEMACRAAEVLTVRDEGSALEVAEIVSGARPLVASDPAHLLQATAADRERVAAVLGAAGLGAGIVSVAARTWDFEMEAGELAARLGAALAGLPAEHAIAFLPCHCGAGTDDRAFAEKVRASVHGRASSVLDLRTPGEAIALFERSELVVAARNHGVVLAGCAGTPAVSLVYDPKVRGSAQALGLEHLALGLRELDRIPAMAARALESRQRLQSTMAAGREAAVRRVRQAFDAVEGIRRQPAVSAGANDQPEGPALQPGGTPVEQLARIERELQRLEDQFREPRRVPEHERPRRRASPGGVSRKPR